MLADLPDMGELHGVLTSEGFDVMLLADPAPAIERIRNAVIHLVILDLATPKFDGRTLIRQIRQLNNDTEIIAMMSGPPLESTEAAILRRRRRHPVTEYIYHPVTEYIYHPVTPSDLLNALARIAKRRPLSIVLTPPTLSPRTAPRPPRRSRAPPPGPRVPTSPSPGRRRRAPPRSEQPS
jgi:CheY-like chemotaxis protein